MHSVAGRRIIIFACFSTFFFYFTASFYDTRLDELRNVKIELGRHSFADKFSENNSTFCNLPNLDPFHESVLPFVTKENEVNCDSREGSDYKRRLFKVDTNGKLIRIGNRLDFLNRVCCFKTFEPPSEPWYSRDCVRINGDQDFPAGAEFIAIYCQERSLFDFWQEENDSGYNLVDLLHFTPIKYGVEERANEIQKKRANNNETGTEPQVSVVIFGMDAVSHLNFQRTMPLTHSYLINVMSAKFLNGYTKVADNTFPNMIPALAGLTEDELKNSCWPSKDDSYFDDCTFIWKHFADVGYRTAYSEDAIHISIFDYQRRGFSNQPTDYFLNWFMRIADQLIGHWGYPNSKICYGPRLAFTILAENLEKLKVQMGQNRPYFHFTWSTSISHDSLNSPGLSDAGMQSTIKSLHEKGQFNNTVLIMMSDHGARSGKIRETFQGKVEESMPLLYAAFPPWFQDAYPSAVANFIGNQPKLSTHFDTYEFLKDLADLTRIRDDQIQTRQEMLENGTLPRGISLFLQIPSSRNCEEAGIPKSYCMCHGMTPISTESAKVKSAVDATVDWLNIILIPHPQCSVLTLSKTLAAYNVELRDGDDDVVQLRPLEYVVRFETSPGGALFESTVISSKPKPKDEEGVIEEEVIEWGVAGDISRVNLYGNQSHCVDDYHVKKYCYCKNQI